MPRQLGDGSRVLNGAPLRERGELVDNELAVHTSRGNKRLVE